jgi:UDP-N-acetylglucosamine:LPS N-acetylglucosamine transferase
VTRAGLGILGELAVLQKDTVLIPLPGTHQEDNALLIKGKGRGRICFPASFSK